MKMSELLKDESKWCQGASAKTGLDRDVGALDDNASKWCLWGAFRKCYPLGGRYQVRAMIDDAIGKNWPKWNDAAKFEDVAELLTRLGI